MPRWAPAAVAFALAASCGGPGEVEGTVHGVGLEVEDAALLTIVGADGGVQGLSVSLTSVAGLCEDLRAGRQRRGFTGLTLSLVEYSAVPEALPPSEGDYEVLAGAPRRSGRFASARFVKTDERCVPDVSEAGTAGTVTLTGLDERRATGELDVNFGEAGRLSGHFNAERCELPSLPALLACE